jgi:hypothetical protein
MYEVIDMVFAFTLEPGDIVAAPEEDGELPIVSIKRIEDLEDGYRIFYMDLYEDDEMHFDINDSDLVKIYGYFEEEE